ncbi:MAG: hypothetical protein AB2L12_16935 [Smithellaceae bacterium]
MAEKTEIKKKRFFTGSDSLADDLIDWASKLNALGYILGSLVWNESKPDSGTEALNWHGESLGMIISDYAAFIETAVEDNFGQINGLEGNAVKQLARWQEVYDFIKNTKRPEDIYAIDHQLHELSDFIHNISVPAISLKNDFDDLKKSLIDLQKTQTKAQKKAA